MLINDLSYCEVVEENVVGGYGYGQYKDINLNTDVDQDTTVKIDIYADKDVYSDIDADVNVKGNTAIVTFDATAIGGNSYTEANVVAFTNGGLSESSGSLFSAVD